MPKIAAFEAYFREYDEWFVKNVDAYLSELNALKALIPPGGRGVEVGIGTGRFALPLGVTIGIDPSPKMAAMARGSGSEVHGAVAEDLPFSDEAFDFVLMVTTICFLDDVDKALSEAYRVLRTGGSVIVGFIDRESELGRVYAAKKDKSRFYKEATFYSAQEVALLLKKAGFRNLDFKQTLFSQIVEGPEKVKDGFGEGGFVAVRGVKQGPPQSA